MGGELLGILLRRKAAEADVGPDLRAVEMREYGQVSELENSTPKAGFCAGCSAFEGKTHPLTLVLRSALPRFLLD
jgi:hypothetical protein